MTCQSCDECMFGTCAFVSMSFIWVFPENKNETKPLWQGSEHQKWEAFVIVPSEHSPSKKVTSPFHYSPK